MNIVNHFQVTKGRKRTKEAATVSQRFGPSESEKSHRVPVAHEAGDELAWLIFPLLN